VHGHVHDNRIRLDAGPCDPFSLFVPDPRFSAGQCRRLSIRPPADHPDCGTTDHVLPAFFGPTEGRRRRRCSGPPLANRKARCGVHTVIRDRTRHNLRKRSTGVFGSGCVLSATPRCSNAIETKRPSTPERSTALKRTLRQSFRKRIPSAARTPAEPVPPH
jgi:hypothetical protein